MSRRGQLVLASALLALAVVAAVGVLGRHQSSSQLDHAPPVGPPVSVTTTTSDAGAVERAAGANASGPAATVTSAAPGSRSSAASSETPGCAVTALSGAVTNLGVAAGTEYLQVALTNTSHVVCRLDGYPGVVFVDASGRQLGAPAGQGSGTATPIVRPPGTSGYTVIEVHDAYVATVDGCQPTAAAAVRISVPGQPGALTVATAVTVCANPDDPGVAMVLPLSAAPGPR